MSQVCDSIDTLSMSYLDDELAAEEKRELELHLLDCSACRDHVHEERLEVDMLRQRLAVPAVPELVRARTIRLLDREDAHDRRTSMRERISRWVLPGSSMAVAAAALLVFGFMRSPSTGARSFRSAVVSQQKPIDTYGTETGPWLERQIAGTVAPRFDDGIELLGGSMAQVEDRNVARLEYEVVTTGRQRFRLDAYMFRTRNNELIAGSLVETPEGRELHVSSLNGLPAITYVDRNQVGYLFISGDLSESALLDLVLSSDLIDRTRRGR